MPSTTRTGRFTELTSAIIVDTETTGLDHNEDRLVEVAALLVDFEGLEVAGDGEVKFFHSRINPGRSIPSDARAIHGITDEEVREAPSFEEIASELRSFIGNKPLVGHNVGFDKKFLNEAFKRASVKNIWRNPVYCTQKRLGYYLMRNRAGHYRPSLDHALELFSVDGRKQSDHGALEDAQLAFELSFHLRTMDALPGSAEERWSQYFSEHPSSLLSIKSGGQKQKSEKTGGFRDGAKHLLDAIKTIAKWGFMGFLVLVFILIVLGALSDGSGS